MKSYVQATTLTCALGRGNRATLSALRERRGALKHQDFAGVTLDTATGVVEGLDGVAMPIGMESYDCRSNRLAELALLQDGFADAVLAARERFGAKRIGLYIGTSSAGILEVELGYRVRNAEIRALPDGIRYREAMNLFSPAAYVGERFDLAGPAVVISSACASSAKAFAAGARALSAGICDAVIVGGVETLSLTTLYGFRSLELLSTLPCRPCDSGRDGISLGEAAGYALLTRDRHNARIALLGYGESGDAWHLSTPHPDGLGAAMAMRDALDMAGVDATDIDYVNLHGTGTKTNDLAEDKAIRVVLGDDVSRSSTKGFTGHALGAAGVVEALITIMAIDEGFVPGTLNCTTVDPEIEGRIEIDGRRARVAHAVSNSFGFGGTNCALVFGRN
ncbi:MAG TPA: beta-ketoacyl-ACP synthase [Casimicrobiaceae bacterium]|nr:beta-ketoacyl-ACP synthase [Casimicrobiaceae bacterium]